TGSASLLNSLVEPDRSSVLPGNPAPAPVPTDSGAPPYIYRCASCKVAVWSVYGGAHKLLFVRIGTLDVAVALTPDVNIYVRSKLPWVALPEAIPSFDAYYDARKLWPPASLERRRAIFRCALFSTSVNVSQTA